MQIFQDQPNHNIMGRMRLFVSASVLLVLLSIGLYFAKGIHYGIDFSGGTLIQVRFQSTPEIGVVRDLFSQKLKTSVSITSFGDQANNEILITLPQGAFGEKANIGLEIQSLLDGPYKGYEIRRIESVGAKVGDELKTKALDAALFAMLGILIYVGFRFQFKYAFAAVAALFHDVIIAMGFFIVFDKEFSLTIVAAILTLIGYSLNDTIVVFDRIRENVARLPKTPLLEVINRSINESLSRTVLTSLTTFFVVAVMFVMGGEIIHDFCFVMVVGLVVGTYSSIFVASPIVWWIDQRKRAK
ncbi:MAG: protein-export membrane protein SecF [Candidatus Lambdaproteobacteria bacterium RIFOXYD1_FULL_56_27]|uniref:Protein-export membrane protein SecF n=1 Tax=Candidatus Lambdaproteobacteria bacterium RIFOXYD2_FULL_56_26 TaxID=1817773 RepID=A0A1F6H388_9PROT|nr:MAG: protein-export membrane protein SecF [Candidatus Lambdaproteobacteria bacterium RIFOXYC1_FULL_56_13]OGH04853.1 MAG: protein-export membrane protein SecF [Candidatus Lambdaproteobacteria bacterium RIFOXYD2_FULL_56_26]OGH09318.1 MAG: protein-export membrane protein SecF [Candidatus Lambdaproteobacteria bacterium RIFOXYD1_FULL_56_27]